MPTATLPQLWRGRSGREYVPAEQSRVRHGGMAIVRKIVGRGGPAGGSSLPDGTPLALKLWTEADDGSLDQLQAEARILSEMSQMGAELPCPRLYDLIGTPLVTGLVMEWCPADLERWWKDKLKEPDSFGRLMATMAEVARRLADYHENFAQKRGLDAAHGDVKPSNILLSQDGRWLISDFGAARVRKPDDVNVTSRVVAGTENFLPPEALFHARRKYHVAMDTWSLAATVFSLLKLQRMVLDNSQVPRNGTQSPRFRSARLNAILEIYGRDPGRFYNRDLDPDVFADPLRMPEEDRRAVRECLRGVFHRGDHKSSDANAAMADADAREEELARELLEILDRAMSIDPKLRFTDARDLAAQFERLTRVYIELATPSLPTSPGIPAVAEPEARPLQNVHETNETEERNRHLEEEVGYLRNKLAEVQTRMALQEEGVTTTIERTAPSYGGSSAARLSGEVTLTTGTITNSSRRATPVPVAPAGPPPKPVPGWWGFALILNLMFQAVTLVLLVAFGVILAWMSR